MSDRSYSYEFRGKFDNLRAGLSSASGWVRDFGDDLTGLDAKGAKMRAGLSQIGDTAGKMGLAAAAGLGAVVLASANFEQAMSNVQAATGETAANMDMLRDAAIEAGKSTAFSATEAAGAIENLAKAGVSTQDILGGGLTGALDLAAAGGLDVATAAELAATAMTQFSLAGEDVPHIADLLAAGAGKAQGEVTDLGAALGQTGLVADQVGLSIEETTGALASFASAGLLGSDAGTSFKTMLGALTPNSEKAKQAMADLGISAYDAQGNFIGLADFAGNLQSALAGMTDEQRQATLETIFGSDAVRAASILYEQGADGIQGWIDKVDDQGYAAEQAATKMDNLKGDLEELGGALETALIGSGEGSQGVLRSMTQGVTDLVNAYNDLPGPVKTAASALGGIVAVVGGGLWFGSKVVTGIADTKQALSDLGWTADKTADSLGTVGNRLDASNSKGGLLATATALALILPQIDDIMEKISGRNLSLEGADDFTRDLEAFANTGEAAGELEELSNWVAILDDNIAQATETSFGWVPFAGTGLGDAEDSIRQLDEALASWVESGNADLAAAALEHLYAVAEAEGTDRGQIDELLTEYPKALENAAAAGDDYADTVEGAAGSTNALEQAVSGVPPKVDEAAQAFGRIGKALQESRSSAAETADSFFGLASAYEAPTLSLDQLFDRMAKYQNAADDFAENLQTALRNGADPDALQDLIDELGPAAGLALEQLADGGKQAVREFNAAFASLGSSKASLRDMQAAIGGVDAAMKELPKDVRTDIKANGIPETQTDIDRLQKKYKLTPEQVLTLAMLKDLASGKIEKVIRMLADLDGDTANTYTNHHITTYYKTVRDNFGDSPMGDSGNPYREEADGGFVPKTGLPYADRHHYMLADGEGVTTNRRGETDRFRDVVAGINAGLSRAQVKAMLGAGGFAGDDLEFHASPLGTGGIDPYNPNGPSDPYNGPYHLTPDPRGGFGAGELREQLRAMRDDLKDTRKELRGMGKELRESERELKQQERALEKQRKELDKSREALEEERQALEQLTDERDSYADSIAGKFDTGLFDGLDEKNPWASSANSPQGLLAGILATVGGDTQNAEAFEAAQDRIDDFIEGDALRELLSQSTTEQLGLLAQLSGAELDTLEAALNARADAAGSAGLFAGNALYGEQIAAQTKATQEAADYAQAQWAMWDAERDMRNEMAKSVREQEKAVRQTERHLSKIERYVDTLAEDLAEALEGHARKGARNGK